MEIESEDGAKTLIGFKRDLGRGLGFDSNDRTISRRHISIELQQQRENGRSSVHFEVLGKNPIWVRSCENGKIRVFRRSQKGEMEEGDMFCVSAKNPNWFTLKTVEIEGGDEIDLEGVEDLELDQIDVSNIDPVEEFGFLVMGHEFDHYPKKMMRDVKTWDWFLEESKVESDDDDDEIGERKRKKRVTGKRKKTHGNEDDDDDWTGESEDDKEIITKSRKVPRPRYSTRSKDPDDAETSNNSAGKKTSSGNDEEDEEEETDEEDEDEDDETLGGFIVDEDDVKEEDEESDGGEEEEEDFDEDDDE